MKRFLFGVFLLAMTLSAGAQVSAETVKLRLGREGEILGWLVVGPFPSAHKDFRACRGFSADFLSTAGGETGVRGVEGAEVTSTSKSFTWRLAIADREKGLDLVPVCGWDTGRICYAYAEIISPREQDARVLLGSDDGAKVWVNGAQVISVHATRGVKRDEDSADIRLSEGVNRMLVKVDQHFGGWGMLVRIAGRDGAPIEGLTEVLDVQPKSAGKEPWATALVRSMRGQQDAFDADAANRYTYWKKLNDDWMPWFRTNIMRAEPYAQVVAQVERDVNRAKSSSPSDLSAVLAEMADFMERQYSVEMKALTERIQNPEPLVRTDVAKEDYVTVAPGGRYFVDAGGKFFTPLGYNHNPEWPQTYESAVGRDGYDPAVTDRFFAHLKDCGVNVLRLMLEAPGADFYMENPVGTFRPEQIAFLDNYISLAGKHGIKLMVTPWDTFWMGHTWDRSPYNMKNGGLVDKKVDFITKREVIEAQKKRWKFIIDRWGNTGTIFAWELLNECDLWWEASPEQLKAWASEMGDFVRTYEKRKWGRDHLVTISISRAWPEGGFADIAFRQPGMDIANNHLYLDEANAPDEPIGPARAIRKGVGYALNNIKDDRPYIDTEDGPINRWIADENVDNEVFHNMVWAHLSTGGAGSGFRWPYRGPHHLTEGMYQHLKRMSRFTRDVPWEKLTGAKSEIKVTEPDGWVACSTGTANGAVIWAVGPKSPEKNATLRVTWTAPGKAAKYRCYDTKTGEWFARGSAPADKDSWLIPLGGRASVAIVLE